MLHLYGPHLATVCICPQVWKTYLDIYEKSDRAVKSEVSPVHYGVPQGIKLFP